MKVSKRDLSIIMVVAGLLAAFCVFQFYFRGALTDKEELDEKCASLQREIDELDAIYDQQQAFLNSTADNVAKISDIMTKYPMDYLAEDIIMHLHGMETTAGQMDREVQNEDGEMEVQTIDRLDFSSYTITESTVATTYEGSVDNVRNTYVFGLATANTNYTCGDYRSMKEMINAIYADPYKKSIETITMGFTSATGEITGSMLVNYYSLADINSTHTAVEIPEVPMKVESIFGEVDPPEEVGAK